MQMLKRIHIILFITLIISGNIYSQSQSNLIRSIESDDLETVKKNIELVTDINIPLSNGYTILNYSILAGRLDLVEYLLTLNVDVEKESNKQTPLMLSARFNTDILKLLIAHGADINREIGGRSAVLAALEEGNKNSVALLEASGATIELSGGADGPYIFFDSLKNITRIVTVSHKNEILIDTLKIAPDTVSVLTPSGIAFKVKLRKPVPESESVFRKADKIFAMSDIEGNFFEFVNSLMNNKIIDNKYNWIFGDGHLVLVGDFVDRGKYVTQVLWLIYKLEQEAEDAGGKVHYLLGNHEEMDLIDDYRFVDLRYKILAYKLGINLDEFYTNQTEFGAWLRTKNVIEKIGKNLFVHAGISDVLLSRNFSIPRINRIARTALSTSIAKIDNDASLVLFDYGVLWYRGFVNEEKDYPKITQNSVDEILASYGADRFIVGHTIVSDISADFNGKIIRLDVDHYRNVASGIFIEGDKIYKAKDNGEKELMFEK
jgi:ankyrin repeat protein